METIYKTFKAEVKGVEEDGVVDLFIPLSSASVDRDGEVIAPAAFKKTLKSFMAHPVLVSSHQYGDLRKQIGEWKKLKVTDNGMEGKPQYYIGKGNDEADWGHFLASKGVAAFSVGFMPIKWKDADTKSPKTYEEIELLEVSQVIIPSNRDAIQSMRGKSVDPIVNEVLDKAIALVPKVDTSEQVPTFTVVIPPVITSAEKTDTASVKTVTVESIDDDLDEIATYFDNNGVLAKDSYTYAWKVVSGILKQAGEIPEEIRKQVGIKPVDIVEAVRAAFQQITQEV